MAASPSPDGKQLVIDLQGTLWLLDSSSNRTRPLTNPKSDARQPAWSLDGKSLCYQSYADNNWHIYTIGADGSNPKAWTSGLFDFREPHWSKDGQSIVLSSDQSGNYDIWQLNLTDSTFLQITQSPGSEYGPAYAHHSETVVYVHTDMDQYSLILYDPRTDTHKKLYSQSARIMAPSWSHSDSFIYFVQIKELDSQLYRYSLSDGSINLISTDNEDVFPFRVHEIQKGELIYTSSGKIRKRNTDIDTLSDIPFKVALSLSKPEYQRKKNNIVPDGEQEVKGIHCPKISPDGKKISYVALSDVWITDLITNEHLRVTNDRFIQLMPVWLRNGEGLIYASDAHGSIDLWQYTISDRRHKKLGTIPNMPSGLDISPDDKTIAITMALGPRAGIVHTMDIASGKTTAVGKPLPYSVSSPSWSAKGDRIVVSILTPYSGLYREGINRIVIIDINTGRVTSQRHPPHQSYGARSNDGPVISPDGTKMAYISKGQLWMVDIDDHLQPKDVPVQLTDELADVPSWSGDGLHLLYMSYNDLKTINTRTKKKINWPIELKYTPYRDTLTTVIHAGFVIPMNQDTVLEQKDIIIIDGLIQGIEDHDDHRSGDIFIDASDDYIMPGLIDMHAHQGSDLGESLGRKWLSWGITSTRDPATYPYDALNRKEAQLSGQIIHPRIFYTGSPIDGNRVYYNGTYAQQSFEQVNRELKRAQALEYDLIKTYVRLNDSLQQYVVDYAHAIGIPVTSHELYPAASYGTDGVEHIMGTSRRGFTPKMSETFRSYSDVSDIIVGASMSFTPTIAIYGGYEYILSKYTELTNDRRLRGLESPWSLAAIDAIIDRKNREQDVWSERFRRQSQLIMDIYEKGGLIISGTDSPIIPYGFGLYIELLCYQSAGMPPFEVLRTATVNASKMLNTGDQLGSIERGKRADLLILDKNPLEDIKHINSLHTVLLNGKALSVNDLLSHPSVDQAK